MDRGRDWRRLFSRAGPTATADDPHGSRAELLNLQALRSAAAAAGVIIGHSPGRERARRRLDHAALLHEVARRTGEPDPLLRAASYQARAESEAVGDPALVAEAQLGQARAALLASELFGDPEGTAAARAKLDALGAEGHGVRGLVDAAEALASADVDAAVAAADRLDHLIDVAPARGTLSIEAALARADILVGFGRRLRDGALLERAARDLAAALAVIDPDYRPVTWARMQSLRGQALIAQGELTGDAGRIADGCTALAAAADHIDAEHSPIDRARSGHALGLGLLALSEASGDEALADQALLLIEPALHLLERAPELPLRAVVAHDRADAVARRAIRRRDPAALADAEGLFRRELRARDARRDPVAWAVVQVGLARVYEAQADLRGDLGERADAAVALNAALDVFTERGLKSLAETATSALGRLRTHA